MEEAFISPQHVGRWRGGCARLLFYTRPTIFLQSLNDAAHLLPREFDSRAIRSDHMHIRRVVIEGFRVYRTRVEPAEFSQQHNVVVGANGSGKSNFFAAIQFVLGELGNSQMLHEDERRRLLHEGVGHAVASAFVEVVFDNSEGMLSSDSCEVSIRRTVTMRKDDYSVDGKRVSKAEVANLLESAGISRSNPTNIVPQGRVTALTTMRDDARLEMLRDVAGASAYDARREESLLIMAETTRNKERINEAIGKIEKRLQQLDEEMAELKRYRDLERRKRVAEYHYHRREESHWSAELTRIEKSLTERHDAGASRRARVAAAAKADVDAEERAREANAALSKATSALSAAQRTHRMHVEQSARLELSSQQREDEATARRDALNTNRIEIAAVREQITTVRASLLASQPEREAAEAAAARLDARRGAIEREVQALQSKAVQGQRFASRAERNAYLDREVKELRASAEKAEEQIADMERLVESQRRREGDEASEHAHAQRKLTELRATVAEAAETAVRRQSACEHARAARDAAKEVYAASNTRAQEAVQRANAASSSVQRLVPRSIVAAAHIARRVAAEFRLEGVYGMVIELLSVDERYHAAVEALAGMQLFNLVVDNDETATVLLRELARLNAGRLTIMPLTQLARSVSAAPKYPETDNAIPLLRKIKFDPKFQPAFAHIFQRCLVVRTVALGSQYARSHRLECVTVDGDRVSGTGLLTGGFVDSKANRLQAWTESTKADQLSQALGHETRAKRDELDGADEAYLSACHAHDAACAAHQHASAAAEQQEIETGKDGSGGGGNGGGGGEKDAGGGGRRSRKRAKRTESCSSQQNTKAVEALRSAASQDRAKLADLQQQRETPFAHSLTDAERAQLAKVQHQLKQAERECVTAVRTHAAEVTRASQMEGKLSEDLLRREAELDATATELQEQIDEAVRQERAERARIAPASGRAKNNGAWRGKNGTPRDTPGRGTRMASVSRAAAHDSSDDAVSVDDGGSMDEGGSTPDVLAEAGPLPEAGDTQYGELSPSFAASDAPRAHAPVEEARAALEASSAACVAATKAVDTRRDAEHESRVVLEQTKAEHTTALAEAKAAEREGDGLEARRTKASERVKRAQVSLKQAGTLPADALKDGAAIEGKSTKVLWQMVETCGAQLEKLGHVNKKALDQFTTFSEQRETLRSRWTEVDDAGKSIADLIFHLDAKRAAALVDMFSTVAHHFRDVFAALVPGGDGELLLIYPPGVGGASAEPTGAAIRVRFGIGGDTQTMAQLSGGQKTMVALCLIFAIQRCEPAPFYIFDEIDAALDATHRASLALMIEQQSASIDEYGEPRKPTQFITTTFRPELIDAGQRFYGVNYANKASTIRKISMTEAHRIVAEDQSRVRQHAGETLDE